MFDDDFDFRDDEKTPIVCFVCGGNYIQNNAKTGKSGTYRISKCRWCSYGAMNEAQQKRWIAWSKKRRELTAKAS